MPTDPTPHRSEQELLALVHQKAGAMRQRRRLQALGAGTLVLLLIAGGIAVADVGNGGSSRTIHAFGNPTTTEPEGVVVPESPTTTSIEVSSTTSTSSTTATTVPAPPAHWTGRSDHVTIDVTAEPSRTAAGSIVTFTVKARSDHGDVVPFGFDFGDGTSQELGDLSCDMAWTGPTTTTTVPPPAEKTWTYRHAYRTPGTYQTRFGALGTTCQNGDRQAFAGGRIGVDPGPRLINGPLPPDVRSNVYQGCQPPPVPGCNPYQVIVGADATDDAFVYRLTIDFGDGSAPRSADFSRANCVDDGRGWPRVKQGENPASINDGYHVYARPGHYTATVRAFSSGCRGEQPQVARSTVDVTVPTPA